MQSHTSQAVALAKGFFCLSIDLELGWGAMPARRPDNLIRKEREVIGSLLALFGKYRIPATWAAVGHLFLDRCPCDSFHPEIKVSGGRHTNESWFMEDPRASMKQAPDYYCPDLIDSILSHEDQEIGCHTFSHTRWSDSGFSDEWAESELKECVRLAKDKGIKMRSFVFPYNAIGKKRIIKNAGFECYRTGERDAGAPWSLGRVMRIARFMHALPADVNDLSYDEHGLLRIPPSRYWSSPRGIVRIIPKGARAWRCFEGIANASRRKKVFHLWFHPFDLCVESGWMLSELETVLKKARETADSGDISLVNMAMLADEARSRNCGD